MNLSKIYKKYRALQVGKVKSRELISEKNWKRLIVRKTTKFYIATGREIICSICGNKIKLVKKYISRGVDKSKKSFTMPINYYLNCRVPVGCPVDVARDVVWYCSKCWQTWAESEQSGYVHLKKHEGKDVYYSHDVVQGGLPSLGRSR